MSFVSSLVGGILGSQAATSAANAEQEGAKQAESSIQQDQTSALGAQNTALTNIQGAEAPYQSLGQTGANNMANLINQGFQAPTLAQAEQTPGYQFELQQGTQALDENAAANGTLMSGNTGVALQQYGQNLASTNYQQAYQNALNSYMTNLGAAQSAAGLGLSSTGQLASANMGVAGNTANIDMNAAQQMSQQYNNAAAARASGYLGSANAWSNAAGGMAAGLASFATGGLTGLGGIGNMSSDSSFGENVGNLMGF